MLYTCRPEHRCAHNYCFSWWKKVVLHYQSYCFLNPNLNDWILVQRILNSIWIIERNGKRKKQYGGSSNSLVCIVTKNMKENEI